jgi:hypothetical protein
VSVCIHSFRIYAKLFTTGLIMHVDASACENAKSRNQCVKLAIIVQCCMYAKFLLPGLIQADVENFLKYDQVSLFMIFMSSSSFIAILFCPSYISYIFHVKKKHLFFNLYGESYVYHLNLQTPHALYCNL